jgi:superfamily I DNA/RNA helicase
VVANFQPTELVKLAETIDIIDSALHIKGKYTDNIQRPEDVIFKVTFTKAAALDGSKKVQDVFPGVELLYISTLHAMGTRELDISRKQILTGTKWIQFKNVYPVYSDINFDSYVNEHGVTINQDRNLQVINYSRAKLITLEKACIDLNYHEGAVDIFRVQQLERDIEYYKGQKNMYEFSDMIKLFVDEEKHLALDAIFLDEAQDLNPSQWSMFFYIEALCKRSYIAGDDDQTIFNLCMRF